MERTRRVLWLLSLLLTPAAGAQETPEADATGTLLGTVTDVATKEPVADVVVTAVSPALPGERLEVTDARGEFRIAQLPAGKYSLRFEAQGYRPLSRADIELRPGATVRVNQELLPETDLSEDLVVVGKRPDPISSALAAIGSWLQGGPKTPPPPPAPPAAPAALPASAPVQPGGERGYGLASTSPSWGQLGQPVATHPEPAPPPPERTRLPNGQPFDFDMYFRGYGVNPTIDTEEDRFSTFSVDVDTASYSMARSYLERGALPDEQAVRVEEFVNTFRSDDAPPGDGTPFAVYAEGFPSPVRKGYHLVRIGLRAREVSRAERKASHLVFVIDVSGSMGMGNRLGHVKQALRMLVDELDARDQVSIVVYGTDARMVLEPTVATRKGVILDAIDRLAPEGSTNVQAGLELGYALAARNLREGGINRIILCSDGVANNGITEADGIWARVRDEAATGITLSAVGFGMGNYNDVLMERLAQVGEGNYAYVDQLAEAHRVFVENLSGTLQVVAKDVKVQVEFDRSAVSYFRLIGYENRLLTREQFHNDRVDAGEVGAGHAVTALYEVRLRPAAARRDIDRFATLRLRYKAPEGGASALYEQPLRVSALKSSIADASPTTRLAYVAGAFAEKLRGSYWIRPLSWDRLYGLWTEVRWELRDRRDVEELGQLIRRAGELDRRPDRFEALAPLATMDFDRAPVLK